MKDRVAACIYPDSTSCRGCSYSFNPVLFDGGCMLQYGAQGDSKSLQPDKRTTAGNATKKIAKSNGGYTPERRAGHE